MNKYPSYNIERAGTARGYRLLRLSDAKRTVRRFRRSPPRRGAVNWLPGEPPGGGSFTVTLGLLGPTIIAFTSIAFLL